MNKIPAVIKFLSEQPNVSPLVKQLQLEDLELQINVKKLNGEIIKGTNLIGKKWMGYTDGTAIWKPFRIPWTDGQFEDSKLSFPLSQYAEAIGSTGWDYRRKRSVYVGFDFDSMVNHKKGLNDSELELIFERAKTIPYISIFTSTSGKGYHIYCFLNSDITVNNHNEHAAIARAILQKLSILCNFDLPSKVDVCGGVLWLWHCNATGYQLVKQGVECIDVPKDWQEHLDVIKTNGRGTRPTPKSLGNVLRSSRRHNLEPEHYRIINELEKGKKLWWWDADRHMLIAHTADLRDIPHKGLFLTSAEGSSTGTDQNCFCFPLPGGGWICRRHTAGTPEAATWRVDRSGWTYTFYNRLPSFDMACSLLGVEGRGESFHFKNVKDCITTLASLEIVAELNEAYHARQASLKLLSDNKILMKFKQHEDDRDIPQWHGTGRFWERVFTLQKNEIDELMVDHLVRHVCANSEELGWYCKTRDTWVCQPKTNIYDVLVSSGVKKSYAQTILGNSIIQYWEQVNVPFQPEYPGNRQWNRSAAKFRCEAIEGDFSTWDVILHHLGHNLTEAVRDTEWCKDNNIIDGSNYLYCWLASLIQQPLEPLPYLFFYSEKQNTGKSTLHEALDLIFTGYCRADIALVSSGYFNGELEGKVLCVVEEINLQKEKKAYERIKDWVTGRTITIHRKGLTPYDYTNTTHWMQCANNPSFCPIFPGDTRINVIRVNPLKKIIPKSALIKQLQGEAPAFLHELLNYELPEPSDRLRVPVLETAEKIVQQDLNRTLLEEFMDEKAKPANGYFILFSDLVDRFLSIVPPSERLYWTNRRIAFSLSSSIIRGKMGQYNQTALGNIAWIDEHTEEREPLKRVKDRLV